MARLGLNINLATQALLAANKERAANNRSALPDRQQRKNTAAQAANTAAAATPVTGPPTQADEPRGGTPNLWHPDQPAAQRRKKGLDPVFVVTERFVSDASNPIGGGDSGVERLYEIHTGQKGKIAEFSPYELQPFTPVDDSGSQQLVAAIAAFEPIAPPYRLEQTTSSFATFIYSAPIFQHIVDNTLYIGLLRCSHDWGNADALWAVLNDQGDVIGNILLRTASVSTRASYDLLSVAVNLDNGSISSSATPVYTRELNANALLYLTSFNAQVAGIDRQLFDWDVNVTHTSLPEAIALTLPESHPLKTCGPLAWEYLSQYASVIPSGTYTFQDGGANGAPLPGLTPQKVPAADPRHVLPISFAYVTSKADGTIDKPLHDQLLSYNTRKQSRIVTRDSVMEWAALPASEELNLCSGFERLWQAGSNSYDTYNPNSLALRSKYISGRGLTATDRTLIRAEPNTSAPSTVTKGSTTSIEISSPRYLREQTELTSFASPADAYHVAYRIF
jgi:hypothetical protein